jgi:hypothetical protein
VQVPTRQRTAQVTAIPAPVGGLNARDALAAMPPTDASVMNNLFADLNKVATRAGFTVLGTKTTVGSTKEGFRRVAAYGSTLLAALWYDEDVAGTKYERLRAYTVNLSTGGFTSIADVVTLASTDRLYAVGDPTTFVAASGTKYLVWPMVVFSGGLPATTVYSYDGSTWAALSITGAPSILTKAHPHRNRLWFCPGQAIGLKAYYLPTGAVAGALVSFDIGPYASKGGAIMSMETWTRDNGEGGSDDMLAFTTSEGQVVVYQGTDPSSAATWGLVGVFDVGHLPGADLGSIFGLVTDPYGLGVRNAFTFKYGADVLVSTENGITSLGRTVGQQETDYSISDKIRPLLSGEAAKWRGNTSQTATALASTPVAYSQFTAIPSLRQLIFNVPQSYSSTGSPSVTTWVSTQYVMNTQTGAWQTWTGMNMLDSVLIDGVLYFIDGGLKVFKYDGSATSDNSAAITWECRQAYNYLESPTAKLATLMQPVMRWTGNFSMTANIDVDFNARSISAYTSYTVASEAPIQPWLSPGIYGTALAIHIKGQTSAGVGSWFATKLAIKPSAAVL